MGLEVPPRSPYVKLESMTDSIVLPPLRLDYARQMGKVAHLLRLPQEQVVAETADIAVSARRREQLLVLGSGERVVITNRPSCPRPESVAGVLQQRGEGDLRWLSHVALEEARSRKAPLPPWLNSAA